MKKDLFTFIERNDSNKQFENHLSASVMVQIFGGGNRANADTNFEDQVQYCNPWSDCEAWNCAPDCQCKSNLA